MQDRDKGNTSRAEQRVQGGVAVLGAQEAMVVQGAQQAMAVQGAQEATAGGLRGRGIILHPGHYDRIYSPPPQKKNSLGRN